MTANDANEIKEPQEENLQEAFVAHRKLLHEAMEKSAESMRRALVVQQTMYAQLYQEVSSQLKPDLGNRSEGPLGSMTAEFVGNAYKRAREMFEELERSVNEAQSKSVAARIAYPEAENTADPIGESTLGASALLMSQASAHLNQAMESVVQAMNARLSRPIDVPGLHDAATSSKTRML
jgi:hypothetical protein